MTPSVGLLLGLPLTVVALVVCLAIAKFFRMKDKYDKDIETATRVIAGILVPVILVIALLSYWPLKTEYHFWKTTKGEVTDVNSRLVGPDGGETKYVVTLEGIGERGCNDTRCASVKVGDTLTLKCKRVYQWGATPGYDCNFVRNEKS